MQVTSNPSEADFILAHGTEALGLNDAGDSLPVSLDEIKALLEKAVKSGKGAPMIVANPDFVTVEGTKLRTMPGTLARWYEALGGQVHHLFFCFCLCCFHLSGRLQRKMLLRHTEACFVRSACVHVMSELLASAMTWHTSWTVLWLLSSFRR
jgi:hypothetical protein